MSNSDRVWTVLSMLEWATDYFDKKKVPDPRLSIEWIIAEALQIKRLDIYLQFDRPFSQEELDYIRPMVKRRAAHEPLQYITGSTDFMNCRIEVSPDVLIPRDETEQLVELLLEHHPNKDAEKKLLDIGTGSGCIPVCVKKERQNWNCLGVDISEKALDVARSNALKNQVEVDFQIADLFKLHKHERLSAQSWDVIISNPPYIKGEEKNGLEKQVKKFEPGLALFHDKPLDLYKSIIKYSATAGSELFLECNDKLAGQIKEIASHYFSHVELKTDLDGNDRFVLAKTPS